MIKKSGMHGDADPKKTICSKFLMQNLIKMFILLINHKYSTV